MRNAYSGREEAFELGERASTIQNVGAFGPADPSASRPRSMPNLVGVELENVIEPNDLPAGVHHTSINRTITPELPDAGLKLRAAVEAFENELIRQALERTGWNKNQAARLLGLNRTTLVEMLKRKGIGTRAA